MIYYVKEWRIWEYPKKKWRNTDLISRKSEKCISLQKISWLQIRDSLQPSISIKTFNYEKSDYLFDWLDNDCAISFANFVRKRVFLHSGCVLYFVACSYRLQVFPCVLAKVFYRVLFIRLVFQIKSWNGKMKQVR